MARPARRALGFALATFLYLWVSSFNLAMGGEIFGCFFTFTKTKEGKTVPSFTYGVAGAKKGVTYKVRGAVSGSMRFAGGLGAPDLSSEEETAIQYNRYIACVDKGPGSLSVSFWDESGKTKLHECTLHFTCKEKGAIPQSGKNSTK
ncbi:MAG: hypothetical protein ACE5JS_19460 [Nitrospinota bacterium]